MKGELLFFVELIGIVAFSVSGAVSAFRKHMDLFGIIILGACTALGGGALRDIMLGITPPAMFKNPVYAVVAALASLAVFIPQVRRLISAETVPMRSSCSSWIRSDSAFSPSSEYRPHLRKTVITLRSFSSASVCSRESAEEFCEMFWQVSARMSS